jgi:hypothetical protein
MAYYECSLNYHRMKIDEFQFFSAAVKAGYYKPASPFTSPVMPEAQFEGLQQNFSSAHADFTNGGREQKGRFMIAKVELMEALDAIKDDVNEVAAGEDTIIVLGGFKPRKVFRSKKTIPQAPEIDYLKHGTTCEILAVCEKVAEAESYTCILCEGISAYGKIKVEGDVIVIPKDFANVFISESKSRKKSFINLRQKETYYVYFIARNSAGISALSEERTIICV